MAFPIATRKSAFIAGLSLSGLVGLLGLLKSLGVIPYAADSPELLPFFLVYFLATALLFVIGVDNLAPKVLKTRIPMVYFPSNKEGFRLLLSVWGRMLVWFLGAVVAAVASSLLTWALL